MSTLCDAILVNYIWICVSE